MPVTTATTHRRTTARGSGRVWLTLLWLLALLLSACSDEADTGRAIDLVPGGDLADILKRGELRVLLPRHYLDQVLPANTPRPGQSFITQFASELGVDIRWVYTETRHDLIPQLLAGAGDLIGTSLIITPERKREVAFTVPLGVVREQVVIRGADRADIAGTPDLRDRTVALHPGTAAWQRLELLQEEIPGLTLAALPESQTLVKTLDQVADGFYDATVIPARLGREVLPTRPQLAAAFYLGDERSTAWAVRPDAPALREALDQFIYANRLTEQPETYTEDLDGLKKRGVLRVLTRNNPATYFILRGERLGFEYELVSAFAKSQGLRVEMVIPPSREDLIPWLQQGRGDLIAASLTITEERRTIPDIVFSRPYNEVSETLVSRAAELPLRTVDDLADRDVVVRPSSSYWETIRKIQEQGVPVRLRPAPEEQETEWIIGQVAETVYDLTVADSDILDIELTWRDDVKADLVLGEPVPHGWVVHRQAPKLLAAVNDFIASSYRGRDYNILYRKYFRDPHKVRRHVEFRTARSGVLSPWDDVIRQHAEDYGFDWRLIVAQMYQESRFDPEAESWMGAQGLMQLMPRTATELGHDEPTDPAGSIRAGIRYLALLRQRFDPRIPLAERTWLALAAYNAGYGHVADARRLARKLDLDPDRWNDNVEKAMSLLTLDRYAREAEHGYCRCNQTVRYVRDIRNRYDAYVEATRNLAAIRESNDARGSGSSDDGPGRRMLRSATAAEDGAQESATGP